MITVYGIETLLYNLHTSSDLRSWNDMITVYGIETVFSFLLPNVRSAVGTI